MTDDELAYILLKELRTLLKTADIARIEDYIVRVAESDLILEENKPVVVAVLKTIYEDRLRQDLGG
jgi:hypothetical protein